MIKKFISRHSCTNDSLFSFPVALFQTYFLKLSGNTLQQSIHLPAMHMAPRTLLLK